MAHGPIPDKPGLAGEMRRLGFEPTPAQIRWLESDGPARFPANLAASGENLGRQMQTATDALRRAGNAYGRALLAEIESGVRAWRS
jgi:hypothetical protein